MNIIELSSILKDKRPVDWFKNGKRILESMSKHDAEAVLDFIRTYSLYEIKISLGLEDVPEEILTHDEYFTFADKVHEIYQMKRKGCYFCDDSIDPNETPYDEKSTLCFGCYLKMRRFLAAHGVHDWDSPKKAGKNGNK